MLEAISEKLQRVFKTLRGEGHLTEKHVDEALAEIRRALLGADVSLAVVKDFTARVRERALGKEVLASLTPAQQVLKIVHEEITRLLGGEVKPLKFKGFPAPVMLVGLQGTGKTTTCAKLGVFIKAKLGKHVLLVPADTARPAAREQLEQLGAQASLPVLDTRAWSTASEIARSALVEARRKGYEVILFDTAGRLHVDDALMAELSELHGILQPSEVLFVADAMTGQDAVRSAQAFAQRLPLTGVVLTKLDGDARGGAALSVRHVTGKPIKFVGVSEKMDGLEPFHPERMASRILGMGDILSLVEEARAKVDEKEAERLAEKFKKGKDFDLEDFKAQLQQMKKMGGIASLADKLPVQITQMAQASPDLQEKALKRTEGIINAMTPLERRKPELIKASRKRRIATGAGVQVQEVNRLLTQFEQMRKMMKMMRSGNLGRMLRGMKGMLPGTR